MCIVIDTVHGRVSENGASALSKKSSHDHDRQGHLAPSLAPWLQLLLLGSKAPEPLIWLTPEVLVWLALSSTF